MVGLPLFYVACCTTLHKNTRLKIHMDVIVKWQDLQTTTLSGFWAYLPFKYEYFEFLSTGW